MGDDVQAMDEQPAIARTGSEARRSVLTHIYDAAIDAVRGENLIRAHSRLEGDAWIYEHDGRRVVWPLDPEGRTFAIGAGKAAASILAGLEAVLGGRLAGGCAIVKEGHHAPLEKITLFDAGHPIPNEAGAQATAKLLDFLKTLGPHDNVFVALTGGASALMVAPADGLTLADKAHVSDVLLASGANISEINTIRKQLSKVKGGRLLDAIHPARSMTLMISDIPGNDPAMIGSGPTMPDSSTPEAAIAILERYGVLDQMSPAILAALRRPALRIAEADQDRHQHIVLADSQTALIAAQEAAAKDGYLVKVVDAHLDTDTHVAARRFAAAVRDFATGGGQPSVLLAAGETTLKVTGSGRGGRNQEFALVAAQALDGIQNASILASGTDGTDGPTDAAGAFADGDTIARAHVAGLNAEAMLANNDSNNFFAGLGDLHITGPTGTNVMDLIIGVVD
jgi:hydroxypyruvate reductase